MTKCKGILMTLATMVLLLWGGSGHSRTAGAAVPADSTVSVIEDTLREVIVEINKQLPVIDQLNRDLQRNPLPRVKTLTDLLNQVNPNIVDCITHPFAIKDRKKERKHKKMRKVLEEYDHKSNKELLDDIITRQREEDEANGMTNWQHIESVEKK